MGTFPMAGVPFVNSNVTTGLKPSSTENVSVGAVVARSFPAAAKIMPLAGCRVSVWQSALHAPHVALCESQVSWGDWTMPSPHTSGVPSTSAHVSHTLQLTSP